MHAPPSVRSASGPAIGIGIAPADPGSVGRRSASGGSRLGGSSGSLRPPKPPSRARQALLRIFATARARADRVRAVVNALRDPNGMRVLVEMRRHIRRTYGTRRRVPGRRSGVVAGGSDRSDGGSVYSDGEGGSVYSGSTSVSGSASAKGGAQNGTARATAVEQANKLWSMAAPPSRQDTSSAAGHAPMFSRSHTATGAAHAGAGTGSDRVMTRTYAPGFASPLPSLSPIATVPDAAATPKGAAAAGAGAPQATDASAATTSSSAAAARPHRRASNMYSGFSGEEALLPPQRARDDMSDVTWMDELSSLSDGSISTHGRGTVASAGDSLRSDDDEDEGGFVSDEDDDDDEGDDDDLLLTQARAVSNTCAGRTLRGASAVGRFLFAFFCCCVSPRLVHAAHRACARSACACCPRGAARVVPIVASPAEGGAPSAFGAAGLVSPGNEAANEAAKRRRRERRAARTEGGGKANSRALLCLTDRHPLRRWCTWLILQPWFDQLILASILLSSVLLAVETPTTDPSSMAARVMSGLDTFFTAVFTLEACIKIVAMGLLFTDTGYLKTGWNVLDIVIVGISIFTTVTDGSAQYKSLRSLRALRALRPLRVISRNPSLKLVVNALIKALKPLGEVVLVCSLIFLIFGIVTTSLFKGATSGCQGPVADSMRGPQQALLEHPVPYASLTAEQQSWGSCNNTLPDPSSATAGACSGYGPGTDDTKPPTSLQVCAWFGGQWQLVIPQSFDNVLQSMSTLFQLSTTEQWVVVMYATIDARGIDMQPVRDANPIVGLLWMVFMLFGAYFVINLFVATLVDEFERSREQLGESYLLTVAQKQWVKTQEVLLLMRPKRRKRPPTNPTRRAAFWAVQSSEFEKFILACILLNTVVLAVPFFGMPQRYADACGHMNTTFSIVFTGESLLKIYALGFGAYWSDSGWNKFDLFVVLLSDAGILLSAFSSVNIGAIATVVRLMRIMRVLRLAHSLKSLRQMISALLLTLPSLVNISLLLFLVLGVYAVAGVQLFGQVKHGAWLNDQANFESFGMAVLTLWRCVTGESWNMILQDLMVDTDCNPSPEWDTPYPNGCGSSFATIYLYSFILINTFTVVQLLIAVVLEAFSDITDVSAAVGTLQEW
jgi:hypothetical protein